MCDAGSVPPCLFDAESSNVSQFEICVLNILQHQEEDSDRVMAFVK